MRNARDILVVRYILPLLCAASAFSPADAGERIIRPRRVNRPTARLSAPGAWGIPGAAHAEQAEFPVLQAQPQVAQPQAAPAPQAPQAPLFSPVPPEGVRLVPSDMLGEFGGEHGSPVNPVREEQGNVTASYQEKEEDPPAAAPVSSDPEEIASEKVAEELPLEPLEELVVEPIEEPVKEAIEEPAEEVIEEPEAPEGPEVVEALPAPALPSPPPNPSEVEDYRRRLELRLLERYNNMPEYAGEVAKVSVVLSKPLQPSFDGTRLRAEFDQLVYNTWGRRIPSLEKEYYVVTFGSGGARQVRSDPSIRVGLGVTASLESLESTRADVGGKLNSLPADHAFRANPSIEVPSVKMPDWWRPEFAEDGY